MQRQLFVRFAVAGCLGFLAASTLLAQRPRGGSPSATAVVDIAAVTQKSTRFKQQLDQLKGDMEGMTANMRKEGERGNELTSRMQKMPPDNPERRKLEGDLLKMRADYELKGKRANEEIFDRETKMISQFSKEMHDELARYAEANGLQLVLRHDTSPNEFNDPKAVLQEIQRMVVYQRDADVTGPLMDGLNRRPAASTSKAPSPQGKAPAR